MIIRDDIIGPEATFETHDVLGRSKLADGLTHLLKTLEGPLVFALDGSWGSGKTHFLKLWQNHLRGEGFPTVYYNAFNSDYVGDPFVGITGEVLEIAKRDRGEGVDFVEKLKDRSIKIAKTLGFSTINVAVRAATAGIISARDIEGAGAAALDQVDDEASQILAKILEGSSDRRRALSEFKEVLGELPKNLGDPALERPLILIVDELDRCRPDFAVGTLEVIKHFFDVPNIIFVLGVSTEHLGAVIENCYGSGINGREYLSRFIHFSFQFDESPWDAGGDTRKDFVEHLWKKLSIADHHADIKEPVSSILSAVAKREGLSLRDIERIMSNISLSLAFIGQNYLKLPPIVVGLCILKFLRPRLFYKAKSGTLTYADASEAFGLEDTQDERALEWMKEWWSVALNPDVSREEVSQQMSQLSRYQLHDRNRIVPVLSNYVVDRFISHPGE